MYLVELDTDHVGGLVGRLSRGSLTSSYATGNPDGGEVRSDYCWRPGGVSVVTVASPPAMPQEIPKGGGGAYDYMGGLVGYLASGGSITSSYATGNPNGGEDGVMTMLAAWWA